MGKSLRSIFIFVLCFASLNTLANHMMGGYIEYRCLGQDSFEINTTLYKDCKGVSLGSAITLKVNGVGCNFAKSYTLSKVNCADITPVCKKACSKCNGSKCDANGYPNGSNASCTFPYGIEKEVFRSNISFKNAGCCKLRLSYVTCCRNLSLTTCCSGEKYYIYSDIDLCTSPQNSSPIITNDPLSMLCVGNCVNMNLGAIDTINHDSISYNLAKALDSFGIPCSYYGKYTYQYPIYYDGFPSIKKYNLKTCKGFSLDSITGDLMFKPMQQQVVAIAFDITEWRNDSNCKPTIIGTIHFDYQLTIVANCMNSLPTLESVPSIYGYAGDKICLSNIKSDDPNSKDTVRITWNNAIPNASFTTSYPNGSKKQQFDFCWQTTAADTNNLPYFFTAYAKDDACPLEGRTSRSYQISVGKKPEVSHQITDLGCGNLKLEAAILNQKQHPCPAQYTYEWNVDGVLYNGSNITVNVKKGGYIYISLKVGTNGTFLNVDDSIKLNPYINIDLGNDTFACVGSSINLKSTVQNGFGTLHYKWLQGSAKDTFNNFAFYPKAPIDIICKISDSLCCQNFDTIHIDIKQLPIFDVVDQRKCLADTIYFDATTNKGNVKYYSWEDVMTKQIVSSQRYYSTTQEQFLKLTITDTNGCAGYDNVTAFFNPPLNAFAGSDRLQCEGDSIRLTTQGVDTVLWIDPYTNNPIYAGTSYDTHFDTNSILLLQGIKTIGGVTCTGYDTVNITISPKPQITLPPNYYNCKDIMTTLIASGNYHNYLYRWNTGDTSYYMQTSKAGYYSVIAKDSNGCKDSAYTLLSNFPQQQVAFNIYNDTLIANNSNFVIYDWYRNTFYDTSTIIPQLYITQIGDYKLLATDSNGCVSISNIISVNTLKSDISTPSDLSGIKIYPNPSADIFYIERPVANGVPIAIGITIYDLMGREIYHSSSNNLSAIDLTEHPAGIYMVQINKNVWLKISKH